MKKRRRLKRSFLCVMLAILTLTNIICAVALVSYDILVDKLDAQYRLAEHEARGAAEQADMYYARLKAAEQENETMRQVLTTYNNDFVVSSPTPPRYLDVPLDEDLQSYIWSLCCLYGIEDNYELIYAVMQKESQFDAAAISSTNDYGLMQINVVNHASLSSTLGIVDFLDPYENVHAGIHMISTLLHKYDMHRALMSYNMGENGATKLWRRGIKSTSYSEQVLDYYLQFTGDI